VCAPVRTLAHACHFSERLATECLAICLDLGRGGQWLVHQTLEMCWLLYGKILPCQYELQEELLQAVVVGSSNLQGSIYDQKLLCNSTYITYVCVLLKNLNYPCKARRCPYSMSKTTWEGEEYQGSSFCEKSVLACDITSQATVIFMVTAAMVTNPTLDHGHLAFFVCLSFPVNLLVITLWAVHSRWSINKAKCRIWEIIN